MPSNDWRRGIVTVTRCGCTERFGTPTILQARGLRPRMVSLGLELTNEEWRESDDQVIVARSFELEFEGVLP